MIWFDVTATHGGRCKLANTIYTGGQDSASGAVNGIGRLHGRLSADC